MRQKPMTYTEIKKSLESLGIELFKIKATINGRQAYRIKGRGYNHTALWTLSELRQAYQYGQFWDVSEKV